MKEKINGLCLYKRSLLLGFLLGINVLIFAQLPQSITKFSSQKNPLTVQSDVFGTSFSFVENIGQYGETIKSFASMGTIKYGYEGLDMPILFTPKGLIHLQRKVDGPSEEEREREERNRKKGKKAEEALEEKKIIDRTITMEWLNANPSPQIIAEDKTAGYHTYGMLQAKAKAYKKIIYKELYPGIDVVYSFTQHNKLGFEYSLLVKAGADVSKVKFRYSGDVKKMKLKDGNLIIKSDIDGIEETTPISFYGNGTELKTDNKKIKSTYVINGNEVSFSFPDGYDTTKALVIDPFITNTSNLTGVFAGKAIDVDYDYEGNVYVAGGGTTNQFATASHQHAKYNSAGVLQWTFNGVLTIPTWSALYYYGGWVVDKASGSLYMGQGYSTPGFRVIRVSTTGLYDNYISNANGSFQEDWKMYWYCNNGNPQIICAGGGTTGNNNIAFCAPPNTSLVGSSNLTGSGSPYQDMSDLVIDPVTNSLFSIYASGIDKTIENKIFKNNAPYSAATIAWSNPSGYTVLGEILNRPYLGGSYADNSSNILALNANYLFYWDGLNLKAFDKTTGATVGSPLTLSGNIKLMQGGIVADACNNVFIGNINGIIKVYNFNGTTFNDIAANDITVTGYTTKSVYDLALDESKKLLYASGDGFVASFDVASYCTNTQYTLNAVPVCATASATVTISPAPPSGSTVTYSLYNGTTLITTNTTGIFTGLSPNITYTVVATVNQNCSGTQATTTFVLPGPIISYTQTNTSCGLSTGSIIASGSGSPGPYTYSLNGSPFQASGTFNGLAAGIHTLTVQGSGGCQNSTTVNILNSNGPALTYTQTNATCGNNAGTVTANATGGTTPYQYSINGGTTYQLSNFFTGLSAGNYTLVVKDATNCINATIITITSSSNPTLTSVAASATCGQNNGTITAFGSGGATPYQYSINGSTFQASNIFTNLTPGAYIVYLLDANNCLKTFPDTVRNVVAPTVTATSTASACGNVNGTITATGSGGVLPYQYSINGTVFQANNFFGGLASGVYTITIKDATGCTNIVSVSVASTNGPVVTAVSTASTCGGNTGTITITATTGIAPYTYSINGVNYFPTSIFNGLAPGNYIAYAMSSNGCVGATTVVVLASGGPSVTAATTPANCNTNDGIINATGTGGTPPLQYSINGTSYFGSPTFNGLAPATYTVYVKDANNCVKTTTATVANANALTLSLATINAGCNTNNGVITASATGNFPPFLYSSDGVTYTASNTFSSLAPGTYTIYVKDNSNCVISKQATIISAATPTLSVSTVNATCGGNNGVIIATGSGGVTPLQYSINGVTYQSSGTFINITPATYTVYLKDAANCITTQSVTITNSGAGAPINTFTVETAFYPCDLEVTGKISNAKVNGSNCPTCTYSLDFGGFVAAPPGGGTVFPTVTPGIHYVTAKTAAGCTKTIQVNMVPTPLATVSAVVTGTACNTSNGIIALTGIGPNTPYHVSRTGLAGPWVTFDPTTSFTGLAAGVYTIISADDASFVAPNSPGGCLDTIIVIVPSIGGPSINTVKTPGTCGTASGTITATGSGGAGGYTYKIDNGTFQASGTFSNLAPGIHVTTVMDASGCINSKRDTLNNGSTPVMTTVVTNTTCGINNGIINISASGGTAPYEYSINGTVFQASNIFTDLSAGSYPVYVRDSKFCFSTTSINITAKPRPVVTAFTVSANCNNNDGMVVASGSAGSPPYLFSIDGTTFQSSNTFSGLAAGLYTVTIKDTSNCLNTTQVSLNNSGGPTFTTVVVAAKCGNNNGSITVSASGGTPNYQYSNDGINFQASGFFPNLSPGTYSITVKDANGCINVKQVLVGNVNGPQTLTAVIVNAACGLNNGTITATASGGTTPLQYSIDGTNYFASNVFLNVAAGNYTLYVRDANLCLKTLPVTVLNLPAPTLTATSSPASCGLNDGTITAIATGGTGAL